MGSHSNHTQVVRSSAMLLGCRVCLPGVGKLHPCKETGHDTEWNLSNDHRMSEADKYQQSARTRQASGERWKVVWNGHGKLRVKGTHSMDISELCHAWNHGKASSKALTNTSQLAQRTPGQPGRHSTGCVHRLAAQEWTCWSGDFPKNKKPVTLASGRPCNTYWSAPWWTLPALPMTWQWLTASPSAVPGIGRARFNEHTTPGGRTRMMMTAWVGQNGYPCKEREDEVTISE